MRMTSRTYHPGQQAHSQEQSALRRQCPFCGRKGGLSAAFSSDNNSHEMIDANGHFVLLRAYRCHWRDCRGFTYTVYDTDTKTSYDEVAIEEEPPS